MLVLRFLPGPTVGTSRNLQQRRSHAGGTALAFTPWSAAWNWQILALLRIPERLTASQSWPADMFTTTRSAALVVCVASSIAAAARGDAAQAAFDSKLSQYRNEIGELRQQGIQYRPLVWTADGRPYLAVTRTLQYAADIASSRNGHVGEVTSSQVEA